MTTDPVLIQRARMARLAKLGQRAGYSCFAVAVVVFAVGLIAGFTAGVAIAVVVALALGSLTLAPAIVLGYGVKAADRQDREDGIGTGASAGPTP